MRSEDEDTRYAALQQAFERGLYAACAELAAAFVADFPDHGSAWALLGVASTRLHRYTQARRALQRALRRVDPENLPLPLTWMGDLYAARGDLKQALLWYRRAYNAAPQRLRALLLLAETLLRLGELDEVRTLLSGVSAPEAHLLRARASLGLQAWDDARDALRAALAFDPASAQALALLEDLDHLHQHRRTTFLRVIRGSGGDPAPT